MNTPPMHNIKNLIQIFYKYEQFCVIFNVVTFSLTVIFSLAVILSLAVYFFTLINNAFILIKYDF